MTLEIERPDGNRVIAHLHEGGVDTEVIGWNPVRCAAHLVGALEAAQTDGYGECFWPEPTGQYWWMFKREHESIEVAVMWSRSSAVGWQHVFRATDSFGYVRDLITDRLAQVDLLV